MVYTDHRGNAYDARVGTRAQVMHGTAYKTTGGKTRSAFKYNKHGRIVAKSRSNKNMLKRLTDAGYAPFRKGAPGEVKRTAKRSTRRRTSRR